MYEGVFGLVRWSHFIANKQHNCTDDNIVENKSQSKLNVNEYVCTYTYICKYIYVCSVKNLFLQTLPNNIKDMKWRSAFIVKHSKIVLMNHIVLPNPALFFK